jgi:hypothetical protein
MFRSIKTFLADLFRGSRDEERRHETAADDSARMLEMDEPMAGAGAQLSARHEHSETEDALRRAVGEDPK